MSSTRSRDPSTTESKQTGGGTVAGDDSVRARMLEIGII
jgi:hypothetical protein